MSDPVTKEDLQVFAANMRAYVDNAIEQAMANIPDADHAFADAEDISHFLEHMQEWHKENDETEIEKISTIEDDIATLQDSVSRSWVGSVEVSSVMTFVTNNIKRSGNVVNINFKGYMNGWVALPANAVVATVPQECRPSTTSYIYGHTMNASGTQNNVVFEIWTDGRIMLPEVSSSQCWAQCCATYPL